MYQATQRVRQNQRLNDIAESRALLLELVTGEPTIVQCFKIIESTCLSQGLICRIDGEPVTETFGEFLEEYYIPFCRNAIKAMYSYGFVPWVVRKSAMGEEIPEVLPPGTFSWHTEMRNNNNNANTTTKRKQFDDGRLVVYKIGGLANGIREEDTEIYVFAEPALDTCTGSVLHATVPSPLAHILVDYQNLRLAQIRRSHADSWNTTARLISTFHPKLRVEDNPSQYLMDFVQEDYYNAPAFGQAFFPPFAAHNVWQREQVMRRQFETTPTNHRPEVYALPRDHDAINQPMLQPCEDLNFLMDKYRRDVCSLLGVPHDMISARTAALPDNTRKTLASGRIFSTNMYEICRHLKLLLKQVYTKIYKPKKDGKVEFLLVPMPRMEVESIQDFKVLFEIGALTPDMSMKLSRMLVGDDPVSTKQDKKPKQQKQQESDI